MPSCLLVNPAQDEDGQKVGRREVFSLELTDFFYVGLFCFEANYVYRTTTSQCYVLFVVTSQKLVLIAGPFLA
jgi:hypothetical protein